MPYLIQGRFNPELKSLVMEASQALARLDADRLEELALSCQALNRDLDLNRDPGPSGNDVREEVRRQARHAADEMAVFGRVIEATRANVEVMSRLRELREERLEYRGGRASTLFKRVQSDLPENTHGDH